MEHCSLCGSEPFEDCQPDCANWETRYDEMSDFSSEIADRYKFSEEDMTSEDLIWR